MRSVFLLFFIIAGQFSAAVSYAMEGQPIRSQEDPYEEACKTFALNDNYHKLIIQMVDKFYELRNDIIILTKSIELLDTQRIINIQYDRIHGWLETAKGRINQISDEACAIEEREDELQDPSVDPSYLLLQETLLNQKLKQLNNECWSFVAYAQSFLNGLYENPQVRPYRQLLNHISRQLYFKTLSWLTHDGAGKSDIVAFLIGARGYAHQEIPAFFKKIARENPQAQIVIYSLGSDIDCEPIAEANLRGLNGENRFSVAQKISVVDFPSSEDVEQARSETQRLSTNQKGTFLQQPIVYTCRELPNIKLVSSCLELPLIPSQAGYAFFKHAFSECLNRKLNEGAVVFIGNNTQCYNFEGIQLVAQLYYHFKHEKNHPKASNLQLYTQGSDGQCIVYDPLESADQPIMKFDDRLGKLFLPEDQCGVCCATVPCSHFSSENGLQYHIRNCPDNGFMVTHVSSNGWEQPEIFTREGERSRDPNHAEAPRPCR